MHSSLPGSSQTASFRAHWALVAAELRSQFSLLVWPEKHFCSQRTLVMTLRVACLICAVIAAVIFILCAWDAVLQRLLSGK
jgi:hypothetical protein